jgi:dihydroflavonol-4-reductase
MSNREFLQLIGRIAGVDNVASKEVAVSTMLRVARAAEWFSKLTGRAPITTYKNTLFATRHCHVDPGKAIRELGLPQTPIDTAIRDSIAWFREHGYA